MFRRLALLVLLALTLPFAAPRAEAAPALAGAGTLNVLVFEVRLDKLPLTDSLTAYETRDDILLPLGELTRLLSLGITVDPLTRIASGFILSEDRTFRLDPAGTMSLKGGTSSFDPAELRWIDDDLYVPSKRLQAWLPLDFRASLNTLVLDVLPREKLPIQARLEREAAAKRLGQRGAGPVDLGLPLLPNPYELVSVPFIDQTFGTTQNFGGAKKSSSWGYSAFATADLLGMEASLFVSETSAPSNPDPRLLLQRNDPDGNLLGPLHARRLQLGSITVPSITNVMRGSGMGKGALISNRPLNQSNTFGLQTLRGDLPPGWDVTLYYNEALIGFQRAQPDGLYSFPDLPLNYGENEFRLVFNGPLGQTRVERRVFMLDQTMAKPGEVFYTLAGAQLDTGGSQQTLQFDIGLLDKLSFTGGMAALPERELAAQNRASYILTDRVTANGVTLPIDPTGLRPARNFSNVGLRASLFDMLLSGDYVMGDNSSSLYELALRTKIVKMATSLTHTQLSDNFVSDFFPSASDPLRSRDLLRMNGSIPIVEGFNLPIGLDFAQNKFQSGNSNLNATGRLSANFLGTSLTNGLTYQSASEGSKTAGGALQISRRVAGVGLSSQIAYTLRPEAKVANFAVTADHALTEATRINAGALYMVATGDTTLTAGVTHNFGSFGIGVSALHSSTGESAVGLQIFVAMGRDPQTGNWRFDWRPMAGAGAISARSFLDTNGNGKYDPGEELIENAGFVMNGGSRPPVRTDADGLAYMAQLTPYQYTDISLDQGTLEDSQWVPTTPGVRVLPRPGKVQKIDFPVAITGEVDGTVYLEDQGRKRGIGNALVELVDASGEVAASARSSSDGYYVIQAVRPGTYQARIAPDQVKELKIRVDRERQVDIPANGDFVNGVDFLLRRN